ncbi:MAG: hypothetical protein AAGI63_13235, partial [Planctomycetota bacterium]
MLELTLRKLSIGLCLIICSAAFVSADDPDGDSSGVAKKPANEKSSATSEATDRWSAEGWPLIQQFCIDCHNEDFQEGELDLS